MRMTLNPEDPDVLNLKVPKRVTFETIGTVLEQLEPMLRTGETEPPRRVLLDMQSVSSCSPTGITILAAALEDLFLRNLLNGGEIRLPPKRGRAADPLARGRGPNRERWST